MKIFAESSQLLLVDFQEFWLQSLVNRSLVIEKTLDLVQVAKQCHVPVFSTIQSIEHFGGFAPELAQVQRVCERTSIALDHRLAEMLHPVAAKSGKGRAGLPKHLKEKKNEPQRPQVILCGIGAHIGVLQIALSLIEDQNWEIWLLTDLCFSAQNHDQEATLDRLANLGVELITIEMLIFEWFSDMPYQQWLPFWKKEANHNDASKTL